MNGADVVAQILKLEGTEFLACYPRNALIEACAAIDIRPILCRQERVGVGMADGFSRIRRGRQNGVFAAQHGPGIENAQFWYGAAEKLLAPLLLAAVHADGSCERFEAFNQRRPIAWLRSNLLRRTRDEIMP